MEVLGGDDLLPLAHPDPLVLELNRLQNQLKEKERELGVAQSEIKALKNQLKPTRVKLEELTSESSKLDEKLRLTESLLEQKNLEIKKLTNEKKEALAAQYAAEATLRRVHANQKDDDPLPIGSVIAPLEADIKMYKSEIEGLHEDKKALERLTKSKEAALIEAEKILRSALERALIVEEVQNHNFELKRQIEICLEENKILEKTNRQKILEVEKLTQTIKELEEVILAGGAAANAIRDYKRQISELHEGKRMLERELARNKVSANRVATVVANEWKDENDKVMPVKQWLEERKLLQAEIQRIRDRLVTAERTAKAEAQLKDKLKLRLKTVEEGLKHVSSFGTSSNAFCGSPKPEKCNNIFGFLSSNTGLRKRSASQPRASTIGEISPLQQPNVENGTSDATRELKQANGSKKKHGSGENLLRKSLWASRSKVVDSAEKENKEMNENTLADASNLKDNETAVSGEGETKSGGNGDSHNKGSNCDDLVSGFLYDRLQKEVITLRKSCEVKDSTLTAKDEEIKTLAKKIETLTKSMEVETKKIKREAALKEKKSMSAKVDDNKNIRNINSSKRVTRAY